jgi:RND family efflux transporter MFP subunit
MSSDLVYELDRRRVLAVAVAAAVLLSPAACGRKNTEEPGASARSRGDPIRIATFTVAAAADSQTLLLPARVEAREEVTITARMAARVTALRLAEGESFARGATLVEFAAPETREALTAARARRDAATVRRDQAARQEARLDSLYVARVAALREREMAEAELGAANAELAAALAALAELESATTVPAPFAGVVVRRHVDTGATVGPGTPLLDIRSLDAGSILAMIPESAIPLLHTARASFQIADGPFQDAVLERVDGMTDFTTRSRAARFRPGAHGVVLEAGAFARVRLAAPMSGTGTRVGDPTGTGLSSPTAVAALSGAVRIPPGALVRRGGLVGVYLIRNGTAILRWIRIGADTGDHIQVLAGLRPGDVIALEPCRLTDGQAIELAP